MKNLRNMRLYMVSLGCAKNRVDSEKTVSILDRQGCTITENPADADCLIVNSCGFINEARLETIETILELAQYKKENPSVKLAVMGCMVERSKEEMAKEMPEIDYLIPLGSEEAKEVYLPDNPSRSLQPGSVSAYLKIAEGCGNSCSFCSIPLIRGPLQSRPIEKITEEARQLVENGVKEIVLVAQDTTRYGADLKINEGLKKLLVELLKTDAEWIRVMYAYPSILNKDLLEFMAANKKICPYVDVPFQHVDDGILKAMGRNESSEDIYRLLDEIRRIMPDGAIRSSFITGFPGETEKEFGRLEDFLRKARLDHVGIFTYSPEEGTSAASLPDSVPQEIKLERKNRLMEIQQEISFEKNREKTGNFYPALVERYDESEGLLTGRLQTQAPEVDGEVILDGCQASPGEIIKVKITGAMEYDLVGKPT